MGKEISGVTSQIVRKFWGWLLHLSETEHRTHFCTVLLAPYNVEYIGSLEIPLLLHWCLNEISLKITDSVNPKTMVNKFLF
jgi:hypothetical protein